MPISSNHKAYYKSHGGRIVEGDTIYDFRGDAWKFKGITHEGGRIYASQPQWSREFFPQVFPDVEIRESKPSK